MSDEQPNNVISLAERLAKAPLPTEKRDEAVFDVLFMPAALERWMIHDRMQVDGKINRTRQMYIDKSTLERLGLE